MALKFIRSIAANVLLNISERVEALVGDGCQEHWYVYAQRHRGLLPPEEERRRAYIGFLSLEIPVCESHRDSIPDLVGSLRHMKRNAAVSCGSVHATPVARRAKATQHEV